METDYEADHEGLPCPSTDFRRSALFAACFMYHAPLEGHVKYVTGRIRENAESLLAWLISGDNKGFERKRGKWAGCDDRYIRIGSFARAPSCGSTRTSEQQTVYASLCGDRRILEMVSMQLLGMLLTCSA